MTETKKYAEIISESTKLKKATLSGRLSPKVILDMLNSLSKNNPDVEYKNIKTAEGFSFEMKVPMSKKSIQLLESMRKQTDNPMPFSAKYEHLTQGSGEKEKNFLVIRPDGDLAKQIMKRPQYGVAVDTEPYVRWNVMMGALKYLARTATYQMDPNALYMPRLPDVSSLGNEGMVDQFLLTQRSYVGSHRGVRDFIDKNVTHADGRDIRQGLNDVEELKKDFHQSLDRATEIIEGLRGNKAPAAEEKVTLLRQNNDIGIERRGRKQA
jgi:hypothetical protein